MKTVVLGISAGIAAYKSCEVLRGLRKAGCEVHVILTERARAFVGPLTFQALAGNRVITGLFDLEEGTDFDHIRFARAADLFLVAPCTADVLGKFANGIADDFLSTFFMATVAPTVLAPSMNTRMWEHAPVRQNVCTLRDMGVEVLEPEVGDLACGETGAGRLAPVDAITRRALETLGIGTDSPLRGERILITGGPTQEAIDPVRMLTSRSSGRMGMALARAARDRGAVVTLVHGPSAEPAPNGIEAVAVRTAVEMRDAVLERLDGAKVLIASAAVSDYRPARPSERKLKKEAGGRDGDSERELSLLRNPDVLAEASASPGREDRVQVGFAVETEDLVENARSKLRAKDLDLVVANPVTSFAGLDTEAVLLSREGEELAFGPGTKRELAETLLDAVERRLAGRSEP